MLTGPGNRVFSLTTGLWEDATQTAQAAAKTALALERPEIVLWYNPATNSFEQASTKLLLAPSQQMASVEVAASGQLPALTSAGATPVQLPTLTYTESVVAQLSASTLAAVDEGVALREGGSAAGGMPSYLTTRCDTDAAIASLKAQPGISGVKPAPDFMQLPGYETCGACSAAYIRRSLGVNVTEQQLIDAGLGYTASTAGQNSDVFTKVTGIESQGGALPWAVSEMPNAEVLKMVKGLTQSGETPFMLLFGREKGHWVLATGVTNAGKISIMDPVGASYNVTPTYLKNAWPTSQVVIPKP